jgi:hypothetical protein
MMELMSTKALAASSANAMKIDTLISASLNAKKDFLSTLLKLLPIDIL